MNKKYIIGGLVGLVLLVVAGWSLFGTSSQNEEAATDVAIPTEDRVDIVLEFYDTWLAAVQSTSTDPYQSDLISSPHLGLDLATRLRASQTEVSEDQVDPVLCQLAAPNRIGIKVIFEEELKAQYLIIPKGEISPLRAEVSLVAVDGQWQITDIVCTSGESAPVGEFSFERKGNLLKSVPPPLDPQYWHLVYEENNVFGQTAPLFFDEGSTCVVPGAADRVCVPDEFNETAVVQVFGQLTEAGVEVKRVEFAD